MNGDGDVCALCGRPASVYTHMMFTPRTMSDGEYITLYTTRRKPNMGLLDSDLGKPFSENFKDGEVFTLNGIKLGPTIPTKHGEGTPIMLKIGDGWFSIFGAGLHSQYAQMTPEEKVTIEGEGIEVKIIRRQTKSGNAVKLMVPADYTLNPDDGDLPF